jgi:hypothetical protein
MQENEAAVPRFLFSYVFFVTPCGALSFQNISDNQLHSRTSRAWFSSANPLPTAMRLVYCRRGQ